MTGRVVIGLLALSITACATSPGGPARTPETASTPSASPGSAGGQVVAAIGTPFFLVFKTVVCGATLVIAPPISALVALTDRDDREVIRQRLDEGTARNCGPPWVLSPTTR